MNTEAQQSEFSSLQFSNALMETEEQHDFDKGKSNFSLKDYMHITNIKKKQIIINLFQIFRTTL